jgi:hypothetical protein
MDALQSIRFFSRARTNRERGFALISAIVLAVLYVALVELMLIDSSRELAEARRFRARVIANTLAENGAELACAGMVENPVSPAPVTDWQGTTSGTISKTGNEFTATGDGLTTGIVQTRAHVELRGLINGTDVRIWYSTHNP